MIVATLLFTSWHSQGWIFYAELIKRQARIFISIIIGSGIPVFVPGFIFDLFWDRYFNFLILIAAHWTIERLFQ